MYVAIVVARVIMTHEIRLTFETKIMKIGLNTSLLFLQMRFLSMIILNIWTYEVSKGDRLLDYRPSHIV